MKKALIIAAIALALTMVIGLFGPMMRPVQAQQMGPRLDVVVFSEELDRSKAVTEIIAGNADTMMFDVTGVADKERARASDDIYRWETFGLFDNFLMNPATQQAQYPENPFKFSGVRSAMQMIIDRDFIVREIYGGNAIPRDVPFHPKTTDYGRNIASFLPLAESWAFNPQAGKALLFDTLEAAGWSIGTDDLWHDSNGDLATIKMLIRTQDERLQMGGYYADLMRGLQFDVTEIRGPGVAGTAYGADATDGQWNTYTAGWIRTATVAWDDGNVFFWACGIGFEPYCVQRPEEDASGMLHVMNQELVDVGEKLLTGNFSSLQERADLIARGAELLMDDPMRVFIDARQGFFVFNNRMTGVINDFFGGPTGHYALKAASVPADVAGDALGDPFVGLRVGRILNFDMFVDGWNPWNDQDWLYDSVQKHLFLDHAMGLHPHTGRWIDLRANTVVTTAGPDGTLDVPADADTYDTATDSYVPVGSGVTATSKVRVTFNWGNWHHGPAVSMDDVLYMLSEWFRRDQGDLDIAALPNTMTPADSIWVNDIFVAIDVLDADTADLYIDFWHIDDQEIAATGSDWPLVPWEVGELAAQLLLDESAANSQVDSVALGIPWMDLTKGPSLDLLAVALTDKTAINHKPPGSNTGDWVLTDAETTARWDALNTWVTNQGHYWPSNGQFYLDLVDLPNRQTIFKADRNYLWADDYYDDLTIPAIPKVAFAPTPPVVFSGTPGVFDYSVSVGTGPTDDFQLNVYFLRDLNTGEFVVSEATPTRIGAGTYRIEIPATMTEQLLLGNFEVISVVTHNAAGIPSITRVPFLILPSVDFFTALVDARVGLVEADISDISTQLLDTEDSITTVADATSGLTTLVTAVAVLGAVAIVVAIVSLVLLLRGRGGGT